MKQAWHQRQLVAKKVTKARFISLLTKIFLELAQDCARLYNCNKTKSCKCYKPCPNFDKFDFMMLEKLLQVYTSWQKYMLLDVGMSGTRYLGS
jgi:hypothetical protein